MILPTIIAGMASGMEAIITTGIGEAFMIMTELITTMGYGLLAMDMVGCLPEFTIAAGNLAVQASGMGAVITTLAS